MSAVEDDGYIVRTARRPAALTTIPGQDCRPRFALLDELFGENTRLDGVIHVVANGFDHAWPLNADDVASELKTFGLSALLTRNLRKETLGFHEICEKIRKKHTTAHDLAPKWLLVLVNKVDLYWDALPSAKDRYLMDAQSEFHQIATDLIARIGRQNLRYHVLPVSAQPSDFRFDCDLGTIEKRSLLAPDQCSASMQSLIETLEELNA